ncbi:MAG TPA: Ni/Fe hydrogenase subunit alpha [Planctomycetaceae bacterium]|jgi:coenzyme F420-reducing hydrogenase alpha subunit|nr:Ni/Fe hydrogenase subunit alpha [Planctomycetaceae bacterium]
MSETRTIHIDVLTRVEGEGALRIRLRGETIEDVQLNIYEPPRLFEALLRGRPLEEVPDITARICGICPVAYQMSSVHALEAALGVQISPEIRLLRRLLYCGEWIESHALHIHLLHAPDFLGYDSGLAMAADYPMEVNRGLRLKKHGNQLLEVLGGRAIHPINVAVGGFYRAPHRDELAALIPDFEWGLEAALETVRWVAGLKCPDFNRPYEMVALVHPDEYAFNEGAVASTEGTTVPVTEYERHFEEYQVAHSTALQSQRTRDAACYFVGPLARVNLSRDRLSPAARRVADEIGFESLCRNPYRSIVARAIEVVHAYEEALNILRNYRPFRPSRIPYDHRAGEGCAATEAPRGLIYHRYTVNDAGQVEFAKIVPPTSQNQKQIEEDLRSYLPTVMHESDDRVATLCEQLVRNYDPCISCSTHFLKLHWERN